MFFPSFTLWGALLGWLLMPRIRRSRRARVFRPVAAYAVAMAIAAAVMYCFDYHRQSWYFVLGMAAQLAVFLAAACCRHVAKGGRR